MSIKAVIKFNWWKLFILFVGATFSFFLSFALHVCCRVDVPCPQTASNIALVVAWIFVVIISIMFVDLIVSKLKK